MKITSRHIKACVIATSGYAFFAVNHFYLNQESSAQLNDMVLSIAENDNVGVELKTMVLDKTHVELSQNTATDAELSETINYYNAENVVDQNVEPENLVADNTQSDYLKKEILDGTAYYVEGKIGSNFYTSAQLAHVPANVIKSFINVLKAKVNFRSSLQSDDTFAVAYNKADGKLLYVSINGRRKSIAAYKGAGNDDKFYFKNGLPLTVNNGLVEYRKPVDYSRISSPFGYRRHPISGAVKKHTGIDYAAPLGTPVYAAYSGTVVKKGVDRYLGKHIIVRHDNGYETLYAHLSSFTNDLSQGKYVLCGARIGSVGSTGRSTGPHLHFGLKKNGVYINPAVRMTTPKAKLCGNSLGKFHSYTQKIDTEIKLAKN